MDNYGAGTDAQGLKYCDRYVSSPLLTSGTRHSDAPLTQYLLATFCLHWRKYENPRGLK